MSANDFFRNLLYSDFSTENEIINEQTKKDENPLLDFIYDVQLNHAARDPSSLPFLADLA
jgi:hypothetical protein